MNSDRWGDNLLAVRQASIAGGTTEINKNIMGEHVLGLPRDLGVTAPAAELNLTAVGLVDILWKSMHLLK